MTTSPVVSLTDEIATEIIREFNRNGPCPHHNRFPVGLGHYHHCDDCSRYVDTDYLERAQAASERHGELSDALSALLTERAELKRDAERMDWLSSVEGLLINRDGSEWTRQDGSSYKASHILGALDTQYAGRETLREAIDDAMEHSK